MERFTINPVGETLDDVSPMYTSSGADWFTFRDILEWYMLDRIGEVGSQEKLADLLGIPRSQLSTTMKGWEVTKKGVIVQRRFQFHHFDSLAQNLPSRRQELLKDLQSIAALMAAGEITKEDLDSRIVQSHKKGRKPAVPALKPPQDLPDEAYIAPELLEDGQPDKRKTPSKGKKTSAASSVRRRSKSS